MEENNPKDNKDIFEQKTIRTYEGDMAEAIQHKQTSQVSMLTAEVTRQRNIADNGGVVVAHVPDESSDSGRGSIGKNILKILLSIILIGGGIVGGYYLYSISPLATKPAAHTQADAVLVPALITPDTQKTINITDLSSTDIISQIKAQSLGGIGTHQIKELIFYKLIPVTSGTNGDASAQKSTASRVGSIEFISKIGLTPPSILTRSLTDSWMFGIYNGNGSSPFIVLQTNFFQNAFAGMLQWEPTLPDDLMNLFNIPRQQSTYAQNPIMISSSTAAASSSSSTASSSLSTTTQPTPAPSSDFFAIRGTFTDKVIKNKDVREFQNDSGTVLFVYAFIDNKTLVIARTEDTVAEIITRFEKSAYVR